MPNLDPHNYSRHIPHSIPVARLVMPSVHSNVNFASVPINLVRNEAWAAVHNSLSPPTFLASNLDLFQVEETHVDLSY